MIYFDILTQMYSNHLSISLQLHHWNARFTNNVLSTAQQIWLRKLGGAKPAVSEDGSGIISAGRAKRSFSQPAESGDR